MTNIISHFLEELKLLRLFFTLFILVLLLISFPNFLSPLFSFFSESFTSLEKKRLLVYSLPRTQFNRNLLLNLFKEKPIISHTLS